MLPDVLEVSEGIDEVVVLDVVGEELVVLEVVGAEVVGAELLVLD